MGDFKKQRAIASELKQSTSPRRVKAVDNIVVACETLIKEDAKVTYVFVAEKIDALGLKGGPKAQSIYNNADLKTLINSYIDKVPPRANARGKNNAASSDEEELLEALSTPRLKSMFRDVLAERDKAKAQMRILDGFVTKIKNTNGYLGVEDVAVPAVNHPSDEEVAIVEEFFTILYDYGFDLVDGEVVKGSKPTGSRKFVDLLRRKGLFSGENLRQNKF